MAYDLVARLKMVDQMSAPLKKVKSNLHLVKTSSDSLGASIGSMNGKVAAASRAFYGMGSASKSAMSHMRSGFGAAAGGIGALTSKVVSLQSALLATGAAYGGIIQPLKLSSQAEQADIAFTTMLGSATKAQTFLADLTKFSNSTPFELPQLRDASKRLLAFGFDAKQVIPYMTGLGNAAAGLGIGGEGIDRLTLAIGQIKAKGRLQGDEALQLVEAGIPVWEILAKKMRVTTQEVMKMSEKGIIPADAAIRTLIDGMNTRFPEMMEKQSKSLEGMFSTIKDTFNTQILKKWGDGLASSLKPRFDRLTTWINANGDTIDRWGKRLQNAAARASDWLLSKLDKSFTYLKTNYFDNPAFNKLDIKGKMVYAFNDLSKNFQSWYSNGGEAAMLSIGKQAGSALGRGLISGLNDLVKSNPLLSAALAGFATPGPIQVKVAAAAGVAATGTINAASEASEKRYLAKQSAALNPTLTGPTQLTAAPKLSVLDGGFWRKQLDDFKSNPAWLNTLGNAVRGDNQPTKRAGGLRRVPYNGFPMIAHKDEQLLTKAEADSYRSGRSGSGGITIAKIADTVIIRQESDIDDLAKKLAKLVMNSEGNVAYGY
ncbi:tape measure protein [Paenibacillus gansuensis]|uniref:Tape measure protein n=1 Tax=Paenibacillus gansuensis TaxID=306542 RepID=A0ABW5PMD5_9BACL